MRSTAGILTLCLVWAMLTASPVPHCKIPEALNLLKHEFEQFSSKVKYDVHHNKHRHPLEIDESEPIDKKMKVAACGLHYMNYSLIKIDKHWKHVHSHIGLYDELENLIERLNNTIRSCTRPILGQCTTHHLKFELPKEHFEAKQWIRSFLTSSVKFLRQLIHEQPNWHKEKQ